MKSSLRLQVALRFAGIMALAVAVLGLLGFLAVRESQDREIDATLLSVASVQAGTATEPEDGDMRLLEWELTPEEAGELRDLNRYVQIWSEEGESLLRTRYLTEDLPLDPPALQGAAEGDLVWEEHEFQGMPIRSLFYPLGRLGPEHEAHVLQVAAPLESRNRLLRQVALLFSGLGLAVTAVTFGGAWWLAGRTLRPVHQITDQAEEIGEGTLGRRISARAESREYERLVHVLNGMLERIDQAFEAQKRFAADASHELRSPLTALRGELELAARRERSAEEYRRVLASALEDVEHLGRTVEDLLALARADAGTLEPRLRAVDLGETTGRVTARLRTLAEEKDVELAANGAPGVEVEAAPDLLERMVWNLVENAVKFTPAGGRVDVTVRETPAGAELEVADTGPGLPEEERERIFQRFSRADQARTRSPDVGGAGLGLAIVRAAAELHGAEVEVRNRDAGTGALFRVRFLPREDAGPSRGGSVVAASS